MRRVLVALVAVLSFTPAPTPARAAPVADLCTPDPARGGVPSDFVIDACVDAASMTLRNDLGYPVLVRREGDAGPPAPVHAVGSSTATVLRLLGGADELLMPGDVARWPLGAASAGLTVSDVDPVTLAVVDSITTRLPGLASGKATNGSVVVIQELVAAVRDRAACVEGKNFLRTAACDVDTASRVGRTLNAQLPRRQAVELLPFALARSRWVAWAADAGAAPHPDSGPRPEAVVVRTLTQTEVPVPAPAVVPPPAVPNPAAAVPPPVVVAHPPAPAPSVPAPPPVAATVVPPAAPTGNHTLDDWWASVLQQLAARQNSPSPGGSGGNGQGNGHGRGHD